MLEQAKRLLSKFIDSIVILIITLCIIPLLVLLFLVWFIKMLFGLKINIPKFKINFKKDKSSEEVK